MRTRLLLGTIALAAAFVLGSAAPAFGGPATEADAEAEISHEAEECIVILEGGGDVDTCHEAPSLILPEANEIIWGSLSFLVLFLVLAKFGFPALQKGMADRTEKIRTEVEQAERIREEAKAEESARGDELKAARKEAAAHIEAARAEAEEYRSTERAKIDAELAELREQGQADAEASKQQAIAELRGEVATLAIGAAEQVVGQNLDRAANERIVEAFIDSVGANGAN